MNTLLIILVLIPFFLLIIYGQEIKPFLVFYFCFFVCFVFTFAQFLDVDSLLFIVVSLLLLLILIIIPTVSPAIMTILLSLFFFSFALLSCTDFITLYMVLECINICVFILIHYCYNDLLGVESCLKYLVINLFSSSLLLLGIFLLYFQWGVFRIDYIITLQQYYPDFFLLDFFGSFIVLLSFLIKLSVFPFHNWMLDVYKGLRKESLLVVSAFTKVVLFFIVYNVSPIFKNWSFLLISCALFSLAYSSLVLIFETHPQIFIGQLSLISSGYSLIFIYIQHKWLFLFYLFSQSINLIFFICFLYDVDNLKTQFNFFEYKPFVSLVYFFIVISLIGIPPFLTFLPKLFLLDCLLPNYFVIIYLILISLLNGIALLRTCIYSFISFRHLNVVSSEQSEFYDFLSFFFILIQLVFMFFTYITYIYV